LVDVLRELDGAGLAPATLAVHEPSLDDVFLALTGRHAEEISESEESAVAEPAGGRRRRRKGAA
jgi:ABC-2 type transport system ATP-binding protein